jgi:MSHA pilin protein MshA
LSYVIFLRSAFKFMPPGADNSLSRFMKNRTVPNKRMQSGFTMVEVVAVLVIVVVLAAAAIPRMMGTSDVAARVTADRVLAALHYAQVLAQRQGVPTSAVFADEPIATVTAGLTVYQSGVQVGLATQNYDGTDTVPSGTYNVTLEPEVAFSPVSGVVAYGADGIPTAGAGTSYTIGGSGISIKIKVEQTGFAHFE